MLLPAALHLAEEPCADLRLYEATVHLQLSRLSSPRTSTKQVAQRRVASAQGHTFACLPRLRELYVQAVAAEFDDLGDLFAEADLAGLPAGLQTLEVEPSGLLSALRHEAEIPTLQ